MKTAYVSHLDCQKHITPAGHPEQVARLEVIDQALSSSEFDGLHRVLAPLATQDILSLVHPVDYINRIEQACPDQGYTTLDGDTHVCRDSYSAALRAVGGICAAIDLVLLGEVRNAFCATRPPGHHAETQTAMGFCLFGTVAIGAKYALDHHGLDRVAIIDFDVHHGNGTQDLVWDDPRILLCSSHQMPLWPGTGVIEEKGAHNNIINIPLAPGAMGSELLSHYEQRLWPNLSAHEPQLILISAGFDAHYADPLADLSFNTVDFSEITAAICDFAKIHSQGRVVSTLEGGYDLQTLASGVAAHITQLMEYAK